jgi:hypothetical protein
MALQNPHTVFFFMIGCPHCDRARPIWDSIKSEIPDNVMEIESANVPAEMRSRVQGFPRFERTNEKGILIVEVEGAPKNADDLRKKLKLRKKGGRRRTRHYRTRRATQRRLR